MSRNGYIIRYAGCPIGWCSTLKTEIALSTSEVEYIALYLTFRTVIPLMSLVDKLSDIFHLYINKPLFYCKVFEDNQSCIAMTKYSKFLPQDNHTALKYHHFKSYVDSKRLIIIYTWSDDHLADIITKPLPDGQFHILRKVINGWWIVTSICEGLARYTKNYILWVFWSCYNCQNY